MLKTIMPKTLVREHGDDAVSQSSHSNEENGSSKSSTTDKTATTSGAQSEIAKQETKLVRCSKALVFLVLLAAAAVCGASKLLLGRTEIKSLRSSSYLPLPFSSYLSLHGQWRGR
jgi:hypothetical protein